MKIILLCFILGSLHQGLLADELDIRISTKDINKFLLQLLNPKVFEKVHNPSVQEKVEVKIQSNDVQKKPELKSTIVQCDVCQETVGFFENSINFNLTVSELKEYYLKVCDVLRPYYRKKCIDFLQSSVGATVLTGILSNESTLKLCQEINQCTTQDKEIEIKNSDFDLTTLKRVFIRSADPCADCLRTFIFLEKVFDSTVLMNTVEGKLSNICNAQREPYVSHCLVYIDSTSFLGTIKNIQDLTDPELICKPACPPNNNIKLDRIL